eukprot:gene332-1473_t
MYTREDWAYIPEEASELHYYANLTTGHTQWEPPAALLGDGSAAEKASSQWVQHTDEASGQTYYYHAVTMETAWYLPAEEDDDEDIDHDTLAVEKAAAAAVMAADAASDGAASVEKWKGRRLKVLEEILTTERTYAQGLAVLKKVYLDPLRMIADTKCAIFTHADLDQIFGNVDIIAMVNGKFLEELEAEHAKWPAVNYGAILGSFAKQFKGCYARYCNNFDHVDEHLKKLARSREPGEMEKHRYLEGSKTHPAAGGQD